MIKIAIGNDHRGYKLKKLITENYKDKFEFIDCGTDDIKSTDFPIYAQRVSKKILNGDVNFGVLICSSGIGISIAANRNKGIRAALCFNTTMAKLTRQHNDANILCMGADMIGVSVALDMFEIFFATENLTEEKYQKRNKMLDEE
ncbi:MAG: ribose 5-phosphate isomerase B [Rickettsiales bacterium]|jgi:ribose 5-phosphate isomerase B|nr:ribose 5-phosphate isomerase B [Rickettsiales bacterium]